MDYDDGVEVENWRIHVPSSDALTMPRSVGTAKKRRSRLQLESRVK